MKAYKDFDEWWKNTKGGPFTLQVYSEQWAREAWKQATRTARVQEHILVGEIRALKEHLQFLEDELKLANWDNDPAEE